MPVNAPPVVQPLTVEMAPSYELTTDFIPGVPPNPPAYTMSTAMIPGIQPDGGAGPDDIDETYLRTTLSGPDHGPWHLDETYEPTTFNVFGAGVDVSAITFFPVRRSSTVQKLTTVLNPGANQTVTFVPVRA